MEKKLKSFTDLDTWRKAHALVVAIYKITDTFPKSDGYGLKTQMQRAALSVSSNIAEGFGRQSVADTKHFYVMARGSLTELKNQLILARDINRITIVNFEKLALEAVDVHKLIHGLIRSVEKVKSTNSKFRDTNS